MSVQESRTIDAEEFVEWAERQTEYSQCSTSRLITEGYEKESHQEYRFRLREGVRDAPEDIVLLKTGSADIIRFEYDGETKQFAAHKRQFEFHNKRLVVKTKDGEETICTAGTGGKIQRGPFPL